MSPDILIERAEALRPVIEQGLRDGLHTNALQRHVQVSRATLMKYIKLLGLPQPKRKPNCRENMARVRGIVQMRQQGLTLEEIGRSHDITRERVRQILSKHLPDQVPGRAAVQVVCDNCDRVFTPRGYRFGSCCSHQCRVNLHRNSEGWNRDRAELIMRLRDQGLAWSAITERCGTGSQPASFRTTLHRHIPILFSTEERKRYFPGHGDPRFRTPNGQLTSNHEASLQK